MTFPIFIPVPYYNLLAMIVSTAVLLWGVRALKRLARIVIVRIAAINDSFVMIKGIGHNLINLEGAPENHMQSIIHTRPAKPPQQMSVLYIPFVVKSTEVVTIGESWRVDVQIWSASKAYVMMLAGFKLSQFKERHEKDLKDVSLSVMNSIARDADSKDTEMMIASARRNDFTEVMGQKGIVRNVSQVRVIEAGTNHISLPLFVSTAGPRYDRQAVESLKKNPTEESESNYAIFIIPLQVPFTLELTCDASGSSKSLKPIGTSNDHNTTSRLGGLLSSLHPPKRRSPVVNLNTDDNNSNPNSDIEANNSNSTNNSDSLREPLTPRTGAEAATGGAYNARASPGVRTPDIVYVEYAIHVLTPITVPPPTLLPASTTTVGGDNGRPYSTTSSRYLSSPLSSPRATGPDHTVAIDRLTAPIAPLTDEITDSTSSAEDRCNNSSSIAAPTLSCQELLLSANGGQLYCVHEVYGMKQRTVQRPTALPSPDCIPSSSVPSEVTGLQTNGRIFSSPYSPLEQETSSGKDTKDKEQKGMEGDAKNVHAQGPRQAAATTSEEDEEKEDLEGDDSECVVCLTEPKSTLLMPCRHLCVCGSCLTHIDKCPVCRTPFEEYISVRTQSATLRAPAYTV